MIADPETRGRALAAWHERLARSLWNDLEGSHALPSPVPAQARDEWECLTLVACVRGLVAAGGFNVETVRAVETLHETLTARWAAEPEGEEPMAARRARVAARHDEYGRLGQEHEAMGPDAVTRAIGEAAARHLAAPTEPAEALAEVVGTLYEALVEGATAAVREAE